MTSCSLVAPGLVSQYNGQVPTFSYHQTSHSGDYFGVQITYMNGASTCYSGKPNFTPVIQNSAQGYSVDCTFVISSSYSGIYCPSAPVTRIPDGVLTISYKSWTNNQPTPIAYPATFGPSPAPRAVTATAGAVATSTATQTSTVSPGFASTATVYTASTTQTYTNTIIVTQTQTTTNTNYVSSCAAPSGASSSSLLSSSSSRTSSSTASAFPTPSGLSNSCPADNGKYVYTSAGTFQITCSYDRDGTTTGLFQSGNGLLGCIDLCANTQGCVWSTYYSAQDACYLKFGTGVPNYNTAAWGANLITTSASSTPVLSTSSSASSSSAASPLSNSITPTLVPSSTATSTSSAVAASSSAASSSTAQSSLGSVAPSSTSATSRLSSAASPSSSSAVRTSSSAAVASSSSSVVSSASLPSATSTSITCPDDDGKTINTASSAFVVECYIDRAGGDFSTQYPAGGFNGCLQRCSDTPTCLDVSYVPNGPCYLKNAIGTPNPNPGVWGARSTAIAVSSTARTSPSAVATSSSAASPSSTSTAGTDVACPGDDGKTFKTSAGTFVVECYIDRNNNDLGPAVSNPTSYAGCMNACAATARCRAVSYVPNGPCYLKSGIGAANSNNGVWGARLSSAASSATTAASSSAAVSSKPAVTASSSAGISATTISTGPVATSSVVCPGSDGQTVETSAGTFLVECGIDRSGNDLKGSPVYPGSYEACVSYCALLPDCMDVSYIPYGPCYLKSNAGTANQNANIIGGRLIKSSSSSSSPAASSNAVPSSASTPTSTPVATSWAGSPVQTVTVTTSIGGTGYQCACTPTSKLGSNLASSAAAAPAASSAAPAAALGCPSSDGSIFTSKCGATYAIECYSDRYGDDISGGTSFTNTLNDCIADCDNTVGCIDVSYIPGSPGPCYKKSNIAEIRRNSNIFGARQLTQCKASTKLKLHRKRVVRTPIEPKKKIEKRGVYGPDFTFTQGVTTTTQTTTSTALQTTTITTTPANVGTTTKTVYTTASTTATITSSATVTQARQTTVTTCPAVTRRAVL